MQFHLAAALVLIASLAFAGTGKISGTVDDSGVPVAHISVEAFPAVGVGELALPSAMTDELRVFGSVTKS
jgi:hypothetical protein